jgi:hypothetical protein
MPRRAIGPEGEMRPHPSGILVVAINACRKPIAKEIIAQL